MFPSESCRYVSAYGVNRVLERWYMITLHDTFILDHSLFNFALKANKQQLDSSNMIKELKIKTCISVYKEHFSNSWEKFKKVYVQFQMLNQTVSAFLPISGCKKKSRKTQ